MATVNLPVKRVVDAVITRETQFPTRAGFGTLLILATTFSSKIETEIPDPTIQPITPDRPVKLYSDMSEVAEDWGVSDPFYQAAQTAFAQNPAPLVIKAGYFIIPPVASPEQAAAGAVSLLDKIEAFDSDWYGFTLAEPVNTPRYNRAS